MSTPENPSSPQISISDDEIKWNELVENEVVSIGNICRAYKIVLGMCADNCLTWYQRLMYVNISIGPATSLVSTLGSLLEDDCSQLTNFLITSAILGFIGGGVAAIIKFGSYEKNASTYKSSRNKFIFLEKNIRRILSLPRNNRPHVVSYMKWVVNEYENIIKNVPIIDNSIILKYISRAKKNKLPVPEDFGVGNSDSEIQVNRNVDTVIRIDDEEGDDEDDDKPKIIYSTGLSSLPITTTPSNNLLNYELRRLGNHTGFS